MVLKEKENVDLLVQRTDSLEEREMEYNSIIAELDEDMSSANLVTELSNVSHHHMSNV